MKLIHLDDFQYLREVINKDTLTEKEVTTILKVVLND